MDHYDMKVIIVVWINYIKYMEIRKFYQKPKKPRSVNVERSLGSGI